MGAPKSVVKISKKGVEYTSNVDKAQYYIFELTRAALRDVGKFCVKQFRQGHYQNFGKISGEAGRSIKYNVVAGKNTQYPRVQIGLKKGAKGFYSLFQEFGSSKTPKLGLLTKAVQDNIPEIIKIESQYLSALEDEAKALSLISESDYGDADE